MKIDIYQSTRHASKFISVEDDDDVGKFPLDEIIGAEVRDLRLFKQAVDLADVTASGLKLNAAMIEEEIWMHGYAVHSVCETGGFRGVLDG